MRSRLEVADHSGPVCQVSLTFVEYTEKTQIERGYEMIGIIRKGLEYLGGRYWRCVRCGQTVIADCECCEPPQCNCETKKETK